MTNRIIPALTLAALLAAGAVIVTAQTVEPAAPSDGAAQTVPDLAPEVAPAPGGLRAWLGWERGGRGHGPGRDGVAAGVLRLSDADGDGAVTQGEVDAARGVLVAGADASGEGDLDLAEFEAFWLETVRTRMVDAFQDLDEDGDAVVTAAEMEARLGGVVAGLDSNGDGSLSPADWPERGQRHGRGDGRRG